MYEPYESFDYYAYESAATAGFAVIGMLLLITAAIGAAMYLFQAIGLYRMAKRLNISAPALAFLPVANLYVLGRVASEPVYGKKRLPYGWILLGLNFSINLVSIGSLMLTIRTIIGQVQYMDAETPFDIILSILSGYLTGGFLTIVLNIAHTVFYYIALYHLYNNFNPDNSSLFLVLSIFFGFLVPIFIFANRNKPIGGNKAGGFGQGYNGYHGSFSPNPNGYAPNFNQGYSTPNANQGYNGDREFPPCQAPQQPQQNPNE